MDRIKSNDLLQSCRAMRKAPKEVSSPKKTPNRGGTKNRSDLKTSPGSGLTDSISPRRWQKNSISSHSKVITEILKSSADYERLIDPTQQPPMSPSKRLEELHRKITDPFSDESAVKTASVNSSVDNPERVKARYSQSSSVPDFFPQSAEGMPDPEAAPEVTISSPEGSPNTDLHLPDLATITGLKDAMKKKYLESFAEKSGQIEAGKQKNSDSPNFKLDSLITEHTIKHAAEIVKMKKQLRKEDQAERVKLLSEERSSHDKAIENMSSKHQKELRRLEDLLTAEREAHEKVLEEFVLKNEQDMLDLKNEHRMQKFESEFQQDTSKKEFQSMIEETRHAHAGLQAKHSEAEEKLKDSERQLRVMKSQLNQKCTIDDQTLQSAIINERDLADSKLAEYQKCLEAQKIECENAIADMESIYTQKLGEKVAEIENLNKKTSDFAKQILELTEGQKKQSDEITKLKRTNTGLHKKVKEVQGAVPEQIEQARLEERRLSVQLESKVALLEQQKHELKSELDQSVDAQELNNLEVGIMSALEKKDMQINSLRKMVADEQAKNNKLELDLEKVKIELLK